jgi:hypothetical protein
MEQTETTPWYPTARLLRQSKPGDWDGVVERVIEELNGMRATRFSQAAAPRKQPLHPRELIPA